MINAREGARVPECCRMSPDVAFEHERDHAAVNVPARGGRRARSLHHTRSRPRLPPLLSGVGLLLSLGACSERVAPAPVVATLELMDSIGCLVCSGPEQLGVVRAISVGPTGTLAILTAEDPHVRIVDTKESGEARIRSFGARGQGPGEILHAFGIAALANGEILVVGRQSDRFSADGRHLGRPAPDPEQGETALIEFLDSSPSGDWIVSLEFVVFPEPSFRLRASDHEMRTAGPAFTIPDAWQREPGGRPVADLIAHSISDEGVIAMGSGRGAYDLMLVYPDGSTVQGGRDIPKVPRSEEEVATLNRLMGQTIQETGVPLPAGAAPPGASSEIPHFGPTSLRFDGVGRLWVRTPRGGDQVTVFDVFSDKLVYLGEVHAPGWITSFDLSYGTLAGVVRGELGVPIVKVWRVVEAAGTEDLPIIGTDGAPLSG